MKKRLVLLGILFIIVIGGCSNQPEKKSSETSSTPVEKEIKELNKLIKEKDYFNVISRGDKLLNTYNNERIRALVGLACVKQYDLFHNYSIKNPTVSYLDYDDASRVLNYYAGVTPGFKGYYSDEVTNQINVAKKFIDSFQNDVVKSIKEKNHLKYLDILLNVQNTGEDLHDKEIDTMEHYLDAKVCEQQGDIDSMIHDDLSQISLNYNGKIKVQVNELRNKYRSQLVDYKNAQADLKAYEDKADPTVGMTAQELIDSKWGKPSDVNRTTTANGTFEQWIYGGNRYVYLENGIVTGIQELNK